MFRSIRERLGNMFGVALISAGLLLCGGIMAFIVSPRQAMLWRRINALPEFSPTTLAAAEMAEPVVFTGTLDQNPILSDEFVAFRSEIFEIAPATSEDDTPTGQWVTDTTEVPPLAILFEGEVVRTTANDEATLSGRLEERITDGPATAVTETDTTGITWHEGAVRTQGLRNGDLVTVYGKKASTGDIIPEILHGGDRVELVAYLRSGARALFITGIVLMVLAPAALIAGLIRALLGRNRN